MRRLSEHVFRLDVLWAPIYLVREPDGDTLVDPGPILTAPFLLALDRKGEIRLRRVIVTRPDPEHAGSLSRVQRGTGVRIFAHPLDIPFLDGTRRAPPTGVLALFSRVIDVQPPVFRLEPLTGPVGSLVPSGHAPVRLHHPADDFWLPE